ncbi:MAG: hypothetical protein ACK4N5_00450 [Myxococcales bacterium]
MVAVLAAALVFSGCTRGSDRGGTPADEEGTHRHEGLRVPGGDTHRRYGASTPSEQQPTGGIMRHEPEPGVGGTGAGQEYDISEGPRQNPGQSAPKLQGTPDDIPPPGGRFEGAGQSSDATSDQWRPLDRELKPEERAR